MLLLCINFILIFHSKKIDIEKDVFSFQIVIPYKGHTFESNKVAKNVKELELKNIMEDEVKLIVFFPLRNKNTKNIINITIEYKYLLDDSIFNFINSTEANDLHKKNTINSIHLSNSDINTKIIFPYNNVDNSPLYPNTYLSGLFLAGLNEKNDTYIKLSNKFLSLCKHSECSSLYSLQPDILFSFSKDNSITSEIAKLCFPTGIKLCYHNDNSTNFTNLNYPQMNIITTIKGEKKFIIGKLFYIKYHKNVFNSKFKTNPIEENERLQKQNRGSLFAIGSPLHFFINNIAKIKKSYKYILVPYVIGIISNYPSHQSLYQSLMSLYYSLLKGNINEYTNITTHLLNEVISPKINSITLFHLENFEKDIAVKYKIYKNNIVTNYNIKKLFDIISIENILCIYFILLLEGKVVIRDNEYQKVFMVCDCIVSLLYPIKWVNTFIPNVTEDMIMYLQSFIPYIMGMTEEIFEKAKKIISDINNTEIFVYNIKQGVLSMYDKKKKTKMDLNLLQKKFGNFPSYAYLYKELTDVLKENDSQIDLKIKEIFIRGMILMIGSYKSFTSLVGQQSLFSSDFFIKSKEEQFHKYYKEFIQTQNFLDFLQNSKENEYDYFNGLCDEYEKENQIDIQTTNRPMTTVITNINKGNESNRTIEEEDYSKELSFSSMHSSSSSSSDSLLEQEVFSENIYYFLPYFLNTKDISNEISLNNLIKEINKFYLSKDISSLVNESSSLYSSNFISILSFETFISIHSIMSHTNYAKANFIYEIEKRKKKSNKKTNEMTNQNIIKGRYRKRQSLIASIFHARNQNDVLIYQEQLLDILKDFLSNIFQGLPQKDIVLKDLTCLFLFKEIRKEFISIVYQDKFKNHILQEKKEKSYDDLAIMAKLTLQSGNNLDEYKEMILLTKSLFCYYYVKDQRNVYLFKQFRHGKENILYWKHSAFWSFWYNLETKDNLANKEKIHGDIKRIMLELRVGIELVNEFNKKNK